MAPLSQTYAHFCHRLVSTAIGLNECVSYVIFHTPRTICSLIVEVWGIRCRDCGNFAHHRQVHFLEWQFDYHGRPNQVRSA